MSEKLQDLLKLVHANGMARIHVCAHLEEMKIQLAELQFRASGAVVPISIVGTPRQYPDCGLTINTVLEEVPVSAAGEVSGVQVSSPSTAASADLGTRKKDIEVHVAKAISEVRQSLNAADCMEFPEEGRSIIFARARKMAELIGSEPYGGMAVFGDSDEGELELVIDSRNLDRRLSIVWRQPDGMLMTRKIDDSVESSPWGKDVYDLPVLAEWLTGVKQREVRMEFKAPISRFTSFVDFSSSPGCEERSTALA